MDEKKVFARLKPSEMAIFRAAADIYAGYVAAGKVNESNENDMMVKAIKTSVRMADAVDNLIISDDEKAPGIFDPANI